MAANKVGCDASLDPRLGSPIMQAPSFTGDGARQFSELGAAVKGSGASSNGNGKPATGASRATQPADNNR